MPVNHSVHTSTYWHQLHSNEHVGWLVDLDNLSIAQRRHNPQSQDPAIYNVNFKDLVIHATSECAEIYKQRKRFYVLLNITLK